MPEMGSITQLIQEVKDGDPIASRRLWERYFAQLVDLARNELRKRGARGRVQDEYDLAAETLASVWLGIQNGRFPQLTDRLGFWSLLLAITRKKAVDMVRYENRRKRRERGVLADDAAQRAASADPSPEVVVCFAETLQQLLDGLDNDVLCQIARKKLEGHTNSEIAEQLGCVPRTVERKLSVIRKVWIERLGEFDADPSPLAEKM